MKKSKLVEVYEENKRHVFWAKLSGISCFPCGLCLCFRPALLMESEYRPIRDVVIHYTQEVLNLIAPLIHTQQVIFTQACMDVDEKLYPKRPYPNIDIIDMLSAEDALIATMVDIKEQKIHCEDKKDNEKQTYLKLVYKRYKELEGNESVVLYGLPEYIAQVHDPLTMECIRVCQKVVDSNSQMSTFLERYKSSVFPE